MLSVRLRRIGLLLSSLLVLSACAAPESLSLPKLAPYKQPVASAVTAKIKGIFDPSMPWDVDEISYVTVIDDKAVPFRNKAALADPVVVEAGDRLVTLAVGQFGERDYPVLVATTPVLLKAAAGHSYIVKYDVERDGFLGKQRAAIIWVEDEADGSVVIPKSRHSMR